MKKLLSILLVVLVFSSCDVPNRVENTSAKDEQKHTELNQRSLNQIQPPPTINWSLERDNLIKRFKLQNDRAVMFYMYVFIEGVAQPIGYYQVNKVSSVNSQLTNTSQIVEDPYHYQSGGLVLPSPAEDGSYGTNGDGVFGFTPENIYIESNMKYIVSTVPLHFNSPVTKLAVVSSEEAQKMLDISKNAMGIK